MKKFQPYRIYQTTLFRLRGYLIMGDVTRGIFIHRRVGEFKGTAYDHIELAEVVWRSKQGQDSWMVLRTRPLSGKEMGHKKPVKFLTAAFEIKMAELVTKAIDMIIAESRGKEIDLNKVTPEEIGEEIKEERSEQDEIDKLLNDLKPNPRRK